MKEQLREQGGYMSEVFTFVDSAHLISKAQLWEERDKGIKKKYDKLNNEIIAKIARDKEARIVKRNIGLAIKHTEVLICKVGSLIKLLLLLLMSMMLQL